MGDCRLRILVQNDLLAATTISTTVPPQKTALSTTKPQVVCALHSSFSADTSIREILDAFIPLLLQPPPLQREQQEYSTLIQENVCVWDCTSHPPKDITEWFSRQFTETQGPRSKTLYEAGWYPSGTLQVLRHGVPPQLARALDYDDAQYNRMSPSLTPIETIDTNDTRPNSVQWQGTPETVLPSHILQSVAQRWKEEENLEAIKTMNSISSENENETNSEPVAARKIRLERERCRKLTTKIRQLETKEGAVSQQVRRMLIKSRAKGRNNFVMEDRVYLHCVVLPLHYEQQQQQLQQLPDTIVREDFCFFSRQDAVGKVVESLVKSLSPTESGMGKEQFRAELLIRRSANIKTQQQQLHLKDNREYDDMVYRRLPATMRLYEAMEYNLIQQFDSVVVRCYQHPTEQATTSILEDDTIVQKDAQSDDNEPITVQSNDSIGPLQVVDDHHKVAEDSSESQFFTDQGIANVIQTLDDKESNGRGKKKSTSTTSTKVRAMLVKSRAKGDAKRIPKMEDRFFFELVLLEETPNAPTNDNQYRYVPNGIQYVYLAKTDTLGRVLRDCVPTVSSSDALLFKPVVAAGGGLTSQFRHIETFDMTFAEAERSGLIQSFDRIVLIRRHKS